MDIVGRRESRFGLDTETIERNLHESEEHHNEWVRGD
jgi:hypothetical protein